MQPCSVVSYVIAIFVICITICIYSDNMLCAYLCSRYLCMKWQNMSVNFGRLVAQTNANQNAHTSAYDLIFTKFNFRLVKLEKEII